MSSSPLSADRHPSNLADALIAAADHLDEAAKAFKKLDVKEAAKYYKRQAAAARNACRKSSKLSPLLIGVYDLEGDLTSTIEERDPRERLCRHLNALLPGDRIARPIED